MGECANASCLRHFPLKLVYVCVQTPNINTGKVITTGDSHLSRPLLSIVCLHAKCVRLKTVSVTVAASHAKLANDFGVCCGRKYGNGENSEKRLRSSLLKGIKKYIVYSFFITKEKKICLLCLLVCLSLLNSKAIQSTDFKFSMYIAHMLKALQRHITVLKFVSLCSIYSILYIVSQAFFFLQKLIFQFVLQK